MTDKSTENTEVVMTAEVALTEVEKWLDYKKISAVKKLACATNILRIVDAMCMGALVMDPTTMIITQKLKFPFGLEAKVDELKFKPRITVDDIQSRLGSVGNTGVDRVRAYIAAATGEDVNVLGKMDTEDNHLAGDLVVFFMIPA